MVIMIFSLKPPNQEVLVGTYHEAREGHHIHWDTNALWNYKPSITQHLHTYIHDSYSHYCFVGVNTFYIVTFHFRPSFIIILIDTCVYLQKKLVSK